MDNTVEQDQKHEVYDGEISEMEIDMYLEYKSQIMPSKRLKEIEEKPGALREMQAKVEMGSAKDFKENQELEKTDGEGKWELNIPELKDAYFAATTSSERCTLILTQGNSAKTIAMCGLSVVGTYYYGIFPLDDSKLFNVRTASREKFQKSAEFQNIKKILGLKYRETYKNVKELRYGHVMIMADQDHDGSVFKGLLINFLHYYWPSLLKVPNFLRDFTPPILVPSTKVTTIIKFYSMADYEAWRNNLGNKVTEYERMYRKGLASNDTEEVKEYFANLEDCTKNFVWADDEDGEAIEIVFGKMKIGKGKYWLQAHQAGYLNIRYRDFINKELVVALNQNSIPSIVDGLNLGRRKILFCAFKKPIIEPIKVSELCGYVSVHSAYHHHTAMLAETIIGMASNYVGTKKIDLLQQNSNDQSIQLSCITRHIFHEADEHLLTYINDNGQSIEPAWFIPIIPMVLVYGCRGGKSGIKTRWKMSVPTYSLGDIIANLKLLLDGEAMVPMIPCPESGYTTSTANMYLFDEDGALKKYDTPEQILEEFSDIRLRFYKKRLTGQRCELKKAIKLLINKRNYIRLILDRVIKPGHETLVDLLKELENHGLEKETEVEEEVAAGEEKPIGNASKTVPATGYHYLLSMDLLSFTNKKIDELEQERKRKQDELDALDLENPVSLWKSDIVALCECLPLDEICFSAQRANKKRKRKQNKLQPALHHKGRIRRESWCDSEIEPEDDLPLPTHLFS